MRSDGEQAEDINTFTQRYNVYWTPRVSRALMIDTRVNYSRTWASGSGTREIVSPTANLTLTNDWFRSSFNGLINQTNNSSSSNRTDTTWEGVIESNWERPFWPHLRFSLGNTALIDDEPVHVIDSDRTWSELTADWEIEDFSAYYSYYRQEEDNPADRTSYQERRHFGKIEYQKLFLDGRAQFSVSQQMTASSTDYTSAVENGQALIGVTASRGLAGADKVPVNGTLPSAPGLIDGNRNQEAVALRPYEVISIGLKIDFQAVDLLHIYTPELDPVVLGETGAIHWDLYTSSDGIEWHLEQNNVPTVYNRERNRYEVAPERVQAIYIKLNLTAWSTTTAIPVTEIEAFRNELGTGSSLTEHQTYDRSLTDLNIRYEPTASTRLTYSLVWDNSKYNTGNNRNRLFQSGSFQWLVNRYFIPTLSINDTRTENSEIADTLRRSMGLTIQSHPFETLETSLSITRNESYDDDVLIDSNNTISWLSSAELYPDLDTTLDLTLIFNDQGETGSSSSEAFNIRWTLTGRLRESLTADFTSEYGANTLDFNRITSDNDSGGRTTLNLNWRPSELVSILLNASQGYGELWKNYQTILLDTKFSVVRTDKTQVILGYRTNITAEDSSHGLNFNWSWKISEYLTFQSIGTYILGPEENIWTINNRLTARF